MKSKIKQMKQQQKERAEKIRALKSQRKSVPNGYVSGLGYEQYQFRLNHIVYCLLRGRKPEEIENKWRDPDDYNNRSVWKQATNIIIEIYKEFELEADKELVGYEAIRANSK